MKINKTVMILSIGFYVSTASLATTSATDQSQQTINTLQSQIAAVSTNVNKALAAQQAATQQAINTMQTQLQSQITHIQTEMQKLQKRLTSEIKQVQAEMAKSK